MITVKEEFLTSPKTARAVGLAGSTAIHLWLAMKAYAAAKLTDGFIPRESVGNLPGGPKRWKPALRALVQCGMTNRDGSRGPGLVDEVDHGYQLHDYAEHALTSDELQLKRDRERRRKAAWRAMRRIAALVGVAFEEVRARFPGDADPEELTALFDALREGRVSWQGVPQSRDGTGGTIDGTSHGTDAGRTPPSSRGRASRAGAHPAQSQSHAHSQSGSNSTVVAEDHPEGDDGGSAAPDRLPMSVDWKLSESTRQALLVEMIPAEFVDRVWPQARTYYVAETSRRQTVAEWDQIVGKWVRREFRDPDRRKAAMAKGGPPQPSGGGTFRLEDFTS